MDANGLDREKTGRLDHSGGERSEGTATPSPAAGREAVQAGGPVGEATGSETIDRDALHQADYGGVREPAGIPDPVQPAENQQGGASADEASGGGREAGADRNRDYDPDGDREGI